MIGATTCRPIRTRQGQVLVPICISPLGPDGRYWRPGGGYTYHDAAVLIGDWTDGQKIEWELSERVVADPAKSTRGCDEPTIAEMPDGRILMVIRGSNDVKRSLPGYKWYSVSADGGLHWSTPKPWTYADGANFFSPASCSQLLRHSNGKCLLDRQHLPRESRRQQPPLSVGHRRGRSGEPAVAQGDRGGDRHQRAGRFPRLQLSNFLACEDRADGDDRAGHDPLMATAAVAGRRLYLSDRAVAGLSARAKGLWTSPRHIRYSLTMSQSSRRYFLEGSTAAAGGAVAAGVSIVAAARPYRRRRPHSRRRPPMTGRTFGKAARKPDRTAVRPR